MGKLATSSGGLLYTLSYMINCLALTLTIEDAFQNLKNLENFAKEDLGKGNLKTSYQFSECVK